MLGADIMNQAMPKRNEQAEDSLCVSSATDCTGLMPTPPQSEEELESYESLYTLQTTVQPAPTSSKKEP